MSEDDAGMTAFAVIMLVELYLLLVLIIFPGFVDHIEVAFGPLLDAVARPVGFVIRFVERTFAQLADLLRSMVR